MNFAFDADALVEADEIGAAAEEDMLAVVDDLIDSGMEVRAGAPAEVASSFDEIHRESAVCKRAGGAEAGYTGTDDGDGFLFGLEAVGQRRSFPGFKTGASA